MSKRKSGYHYLPPAESSTRESLQDLLTEAMSDKGKMAGSIGAISRYLTDVGVSKAGSVQQRVKMLTILYEEERQKNKRLELMLQITGEQGNEE